MPGQFVTWSLGQFQSWILILMRVAPILFMMPLLDSRQFPALVKIGLSLTVSLILLPLVKVNPRLLPSTPYEFAFFLVAELLLGLILGLSVKIVFVAIQMGGELAGYQMGFSMASVLDPQSGANSTVIAQFYYFIALLLFLTIDGHHWFFRALVQSFHLLAPGEIHLGPGLYQHLLALTGNMFTIAVKIVAPVMAVLIFAQIALAILARAAPQVNVLITSFGLTITLGILFVGLSLDLFEPYMESLLAEAGKGLSTVLLPLMRR